MSDTVTQSLPLNENSANKYVRALFANILHRSAQPDEVSYWVNFVMDSKDPIDLFYRFCNSTESKNIIDQARKAKLGFPTGHFYSTIPDLEEIKSDRERIFGNRSLMDLALDVDRQVENVKRICLHSITMPFSDEKQEKFRYHYNNTSFAFGDAFFYWGMLAELKPSRLIEIGSGYTSALALDAVDILGMNTRCTFIDPYPGLLKKVAAPISETHNVVVSRIQEVDPDIVRELGPNDILFIDSSHVVKVGSDVHYEITELLPRLGSGTVVHFHDTFYPFEYPEKWLTEENIFWNELYFLHAFLMNNNDFEIVLFNDFVGKQCLHAIDFIPPGILARVKVNPGGGLWLRRK